MWVAKRMCQDPGCVTCESEVWLSDQKREARKQGTAQPSFMVQSMSNLCRCEGCNYVGQCMDCILKGKDARYEGESSRSPRQHQGHHSRDLKAGMAASPLKFHSLEAHGGRTPRFLYAVRTPEPRPLYRAVQESVWIANLPAWTGQPQPLPGVGVPRVPILVTRGGDKDAPSNTMITGETDHDPQWTLRMLEEIKSGSRKRVCLWTQEERHRDSERERQASQQGEETLGDRPRPGKRQRKSQKDQLTSGLMLGAPGGEEEQPPQPQDEDKEPTGPAEQPETPQRTTETIVPQPAARIGSRDICERQETGATGTTGGDENAAGLRSGSKRRGPVPGPDCPATGTVRKTKPKPQPPQPEEVGPSGRLPGTRKLGKAVMKSHMLGMAAWLSGDTSLSLRASSMNPAGSRSSIQQQQQSCMPSPKDNPDFYRADNKFHGSRSVDQPAVTTTSSCTRGLEGGRRRRRRLRRTRSRSPEKMKVTGYHNRPCPPDGANGIPGNPHGFVPEALYIVNCNLSHCCPRLGSGVLSILLSP